MKSRVLFCCLVFGAMTARAYWVDTPLNQLASDSDCVVIGRVIGLQPNTNTLRVQVTMRELDVLKGGEFVRDSITFDAPYTLNHCVVFSLKADQVSPKPLPLESNGVLITTLTLSPMFAGDLPQTVVKPSTWRGNEFEVTHLNSFRTNETCAVFLMRDSEKPSSLRLVSESDGKFNFDRATMQLRKAVLGSPNDIPFETFGQIVKTSSLPSTRVIVIAPNIAPVTAPALTLTNLPIDLILPRAITR